MTHYLSNNGTSACGLNMDRTVRNPEWPDEWIDYTLRFARTVFEVDCRNCRWTEIFKDDVRQRLNDVQAQMAQLEIEAARLRRCFPQPTKSNH